SRAEKRENQVGLPNARTPVRPESGLIVIGSAESLHEPRGWFAVYRHQTSVPPHSPSTPEGWKQSLFGWEVAQQLERGGGEQVFRPLMDSGVVPVELAVEFGEKHGYPPPGKE